VDYDTLVDSPIVAGKLGVHEFTVNGSRHLLVDAGDVNAQWNGQRAADDLERLVREHRRFWGALPFQRYVFLNVARQGGGGLEHRDSTLLTASPSTTRPTRSWLAFVSHEYFHAFNVKRLRPVELDAFDYEQPPRTSSLWVSEGLTTYYGELLVTRAGLSTAEQFLTWLSSQIERLQTQPGRLAQTLEQASLDVWSTPASGLARNAPTNTVSYYVKGPVVGFLLDATVQRASAGRKSLDDVMRLAYARYSGKRGFTSAEFQQVASNIAGQELQDWFRRALASTEELDYTAALDWFGLQFVSAESSGSRWKLEIRADATAAQKAHWQKLTDPMATKR
jgi:predicted metalloprotease with PDZ domain